jgi:hypothetical protein
VKTIIFFTKVGVFYEKPKYLKNKKRYLETFVSKYRFVGRSGG